MGVKKKGKRKKRYKNLVKALDFNLKPLKREKRERKICKPGSVFLELIERGSHLSGPE